MKLFVTAIGTDCGKTIVSSIIVEALEADYWKPVQAGYPKDSDTVRHLISNSKTLIHPEAYLLKTPESPHAAARKDNLEIDMARIVLPETSNHLVVEGAGGVLVPLNERDYVIDVASRFNLEIIIVANIYLGSINHTLLTIAELQRRNLNIKGIIFNGENKESEEIILKNSGLNCLLKLQKEKEITPSIIKRYALELRHALLL